MCQQAVNRVLASLECELRARNASTGGIAPRGSVRQWREQLDSSDLSLAERRALEGLDLGAVGRFLATGAERRLSARTAVKLV